MIFCFSSPNTSARRCLIFSLPLFTFISWVILEPIFSEEKGSISSLFTTTQDQVSKDISSNRECFVRGRQVSDLSGSWVNRTKRDNHKYYYTNTCRDKVMTKFAFCTEKKHPNCPWIMGHYWCGRERSQKIELLDYDTYHCKLQLLEPSGLLDVIGTGNTLWYIGDSMTSEMYISTLCVLKDFALPYFQTGKVIPNPIRAANKLRVSASSCVKFVRDIRICFLKSRRAAELSSLLKDLYGKGWKTDDFLVINYGLHVNSTLQTDIRNAFTTYGRKFRNTRGEPLILWRETSAQHFVNPGGVYTPEALKMPCAPLREENYLLANAINLEIRGLLDELEIPVLETWSISSARYDAHSNGECSHLCLPGVPDQWVRVLQAYLFSFKTAYSGQ